MEQYDGVQGDPAGGASGDARPLAAASSATGSRLLDELRALRLEIAELRRELAALRQVLHARPPAPPALVEAQPACGPAAQSPTLPLPAPASPAPVAAPSPVTAAARPPPLPVADPLAELRAALEGAAVFEGPSALAARHLHSRFNAGEAEPEVQAEAAIALASIPAAEPQLLRWLASQHRTVDCAAAVLALLRAELVPRAQIVQIVLGRRIDDAAAGDLLESTESATHLKHRPALLTLLTSIGFQLVDQPERPDDNRFHQWPRLDESGAGGASGRRMLAPALITGPGGSVLRRGLCWRIVTSISGAPAPLAAPADQFARAERIAILQDLAVASADGVVWKLEPGGQVRQKTPAEVDFDLAQRIVLLRNPGDRASHAFAAFFQEILRLRPASNPYQPVGSWKQRQEAFQLASRWYMEQLRLAPVDNVIGKPIHQVDQFDTVSVRGDARYRGRIVEVPVPAIRCGPTILLQGFAFYPN